VLARFNQLLSFTTRYGVRENHRLDAWSLQGVFSDNLGFEFPTWNSIHYPLLEKYKKSKDVRRDASAPQEDLHMQMSFRRCVPYDLGSCLPCDLDRVPGKYLTYQHLEKHVALKYTGDCVTLNTKNSDRMSWVKIKVDDCYAVFRIVVGFDINTKETAFMLEPVRVNSPVDNKTLSQLIVSSWGADKYPRLDMTSEQAVNAQDKLGEIFARPVSILECPLLISVKLRDAMKAFNTYETVVQNVNRELTNLTWYRISSPNVTTSTMKLVKVEKSTKKDDTKDAPQPRSAVSGLVSEFLPREMALLKTGYVGVGRGIQANCAWGTGSATGSSLGKHNEVSATLIRMLREWTLDRMVWACTPSSGVILKDCRNVLDTDAFLQQHSLACSVPPLVVYYFNGMERSADARFPDSAGVDLTLVEKNEKSKLPLKRVLVDDNSTSRAKCRRVERAPLTPTETTSIRVAKPRADTVRRRSSAASAAITPLLPAVSAKPLVIAGDSTSDTPVDGTASAATILQSVLSQSATARRVTAIAPGAPPSSSTLPSNLLSGETLSEWLELGKEMFQSQ
jgi:hypothetical protein